MLDDNAKKILNLRLPRVRIATGRKGGFPKGYTPHPNQLKALRAGAVPAGKVLNPYGHYGDCQRSRYRVTWFGLKLKPAWREKAMKRKRIRLKIRKAIALEAHQLQLMARENASLAMATLVEISRNKRAPEATRIAASSVILDRAYGKASQTSITANVTNGKAKELDGTELDKRINQTLRRVEVLTNRTPKTGPSQKRPADLRKLN